MASGQPSKEEIIQNWSIFIWKCKVMQITAAAQRITDVFRLLTGWGLIHKAIFDYELKLSWTMANHRKISQSDQICNGKVSPFKAIVWSWRRGKTNILASKAVSCQGIPCGVQKYFLVQIFLPFKARAWRDTVKEVRRGWSFVLDKQLALLSHPHSPSTLT